MHQMNAVERFELGGIEARQSHHRDIADYTMMALTGFRKYEAVAVQRMYIL